MKLVKEHINFERSLDPKDAMDVGDKYNIEHELNTLVKEFGGTFKIEEHENTLAPNKPGWLEGTYNYKKIVDSIPYEYSFFIKFFPINNGYSVGYIKPSYNKNPEWFFSNARECKKQIRDWMKDISLPFLNI